MDTISQKAINIQQQFTPVADNERGGLQIHPDASIHCTGFHMVPLHLRLGFNPCDAGFSFCQQPNKNSHNLGSHGFIRQSHVKCVTPLL